MTHNRLQVLKKRIDIACKRSGRDPHELDLVVVTKQVAPARILEAYAAGVRDFGENRVQELLGKRESLPNDIRWHLVGSLQTNKVKYVVGQVFLIHSLDRLDLAKAIQEEAEKKGETVQVLIQVNTSGEETKHGFQPEEAQRAIRQMMPYDRVVVRGLMTIGPLTDDQEKTRSSFRLLRRLRDEVQNEFASLDWHYLSMGMSSDFEIAVEEGANCLRIGTAVFGPRTPPP